MLLEGHLTIESGIEGFHPLSGLLVIRRVNLDAADSVTIIFT